MQEVSQSPSVGSWNEAGLGVTMVLCSKRPRCPGRHFRTQHIWTLQDSRVPPSPLPSALSRSQRGNNAQDKPLPTGTHVMGEGVGRDPHNGLAQHLSLVVNAFDGQEDLGGRGTTW